MPSRSMITAMAPTSENADSPPVTAAAQAENPSASLERDEAQEREPTARQGAPGAQPPAEGPHEPTGETPTDETDVAAHEDSRHHRLKAENEALYQRLLRLQAEFDNFRKRTEREKQDFFDYAPTLYASCCRSWTHLNGGLRLPRARRLQTTRRGFSWS